MEEKEKYFVSDVQYDLSMFRENMAYFVTPGRKWFAGIMVGVLVIYTLAVGFWDLKLLKWCCAACLLSLAFAAYRNRDGGKAYRQVLEQTGGAPRRNLVYIREAGIRYRNPESENTKDLAYADITAISRTRTLFVLHGSDGQAYCISHQSLTGGTADDLQQWLMQKTGVTKVAKPVDVRIFRKAGTILAALGLALALILEGGIFASQPKSMTLSEATQVLTELGIDVPQTELEEGLPDPYMVQELLCWAGMGSYEDDGWEWTPAESGVYAFDMEFFDVGSMYTDFLRGVHAMSGGELVFTDIIEDNSHVDDESGGGWKEVTFTVNGRTHTLRPELMYDWFDPSFANALAELTEDSGSGKRLRFFCDGYQIAYVFWCDDVWARDFSRTTGLRLTEKIA